MKVTLMSAGKEHELDVHEGQTIAEVAASQGVNVYGSCGGEGRCFGCSRRVVAGLEKLFNIRTEKRYEAEDGFAPYAQTCKTIPIEDGAIIDADHKARMW